jgi:hypothetical protein
MEPGRYAFYLSNVKYLYVSNTNISSSTQYPIYMISTNYISRDIIFSNCVFDVTKSYDAGSSYFHHHPIRFHNHNNINGNHFVYHLGYLGSVKVQRNTTDVRSTNNSCVEFVMDTRYNNDPRNTICQNIYNIKSIPSANNYIDFYGKADAGFTGKVYKELEFNKGIVDDKEEITLSTDWQQYTLSHTPSTSAEGWYNIKIYAYGDGGSLYFDDISHVITSS